LLQNYLILQKEKTFDKSIFNTPVKVLLRSI